MFQFLKWDVFRLCAFAIVLTIFSCSSVSACLNDQELPQREREFRSAYQSESIAGTEPPAAPYLQNSQLLSIAGGLMLVGAVVVVFKSVQNRV